MFWVIFWENRLSSVGSFGSLDRYNAIGGRSTGFAPTQPQNYDARKNFSNAPTLDGDGFPWQGREFLMNFGWRWGDRFKFLGYHSGGVWGANQ